jgi:exonuclease III
MKLAAIASSMSDVILLSDTRVLSSRGVSSTERIQKSLRDCKICSYNAYFHSNANSRGVAILIKNELSYNILREYRDDMENFYMLDVEINKTRYGIGAVFGPNNTSREFYRHIRNTLMDVSNKGCINVILGGDWNTTVDRRPVTENIDTFHMSGLPNPKNSELLELLCTDLSLTDPYRILNPDKRDYTYSPFGNVRLNRSRLDFFIISSNLIGYISGCSIADSVSCKLFDHKPVCLQLNQALPQTKSPCRLNNRFLDNKMLEISIEIAVRRVHLYSLECNNDNQNNVMLKERELAQINDILASYRNLTTILGNVAKQGGDSAGDINVAASQQDIRNKLDDMSSLTDLELANKNCTDVEFFVALTNEVRRRSHPKILGQIKQYGRHWAR